MQLLGMTVHDIDGLAMHASCMHLVLHKLFILLPCCVHVMWPGDRGCSYANGFLISQGHTQTGKMEEHIDMEQTIKRSQS